VADFFFASKIARENGKQLVLDFYRRYESRTKVARKSVEESSENVIIELFSANSFANGAEPFQVVRDSVVHELDLVIYLAWPFVTADLTEVLVTANELQLSLSFVKSYGKTVSAKISCQNNASDIRQDIFVNGTAINNNTSPRNLGYQGVFSAFYQAIKFSTPTESGVEHPSLFWTYQILEKVLEKVKGTIFSH